SAAASEPPRREYFIVGRPLLLHVRVRIRHGEPPRFQPARPVAEIVLRDAHHLHRRDDRWYVLFQVHFFEDALDRDVAPVVGRQGQQHRRQSILDEGELRRQATDGNDLDLLGIQLLEQPWWRDERPSADHRPPLNL